MFDFDAYVQQPGSPVEWAALNQRAREQTMDVVGATQAQTNNNALADIDNQQQQQQLDETARSNLASEEDQLRQRMLSEQQHAFNKEKYAHEKQMAFRQDKAALLKTMRRKEDVNGAIRALQESYGFLQVPGERPDAGMQGPGVPPPPGYVPDTQAIDADYNQVLSGNIGPGAEMTPINESTNPASSDVSLTRAVVKNIGSRSLGMTDGGRSARPESTPPPLTPEAEHAEITARLNQPIVERTEEEDAEIEAKLNAPIVDLKTSIEEEDKAEAAERFAAGSAKIREFKLTDPLVEAAALNELAEVTGQPRVGPTVPDAGPFDPPEMQTSPTDRIPAEILEIINGSRAPDDDVVAGIAQAGGRYHVVDAETGQVVDEGDLWEEQRDEQVAERLTTARMIFDDIPEGTDEWKMFESHAQAYANAWDDKEAERDLEILKMRFKDRGDTKRAGIMAMQRDESGERAGIGQELQILKAVADHEKSILGEVKGAFNVKKLMDLDSSLTNNLNTLANEPNQQQQRQLRRQMATAIEARLTDKDAQEYQEAGMASRLTETMNRLLGDGELDPKFLDTMRDTLGDAQKQSRAKMTSFMESVERTILNDPTLQGMGETDEELWNRKEAALGRLIPGYKPRTKRQASKLGGGKPTSKRTSKTRSLSVSDAEAEADGVEF